MKNDQLAKNLTLEQKGKTYTGVENPNKLSKVPVIYSDESGRQICSAHRSNGQSVCTSTILMTNGRCKKHGGATPSGIASPHFKTGRHSRSIPSRLLSKYEEALNDPDLMNMTADIALTDARIDDLMLQADEGGGGDIFTEIDEAHSSFKVANAEGDKKMMREALRRLDESIKRGRSEHFVWIEIRQLQDHRRKLVLAQSKHLQMTGQMVTVKDVNLLIAALLDAVQREVSDRRVVGRIAEQFHRIAQGSSVQKQIDSKN